MPKELSPDVEALAQRLLLRATTTGGGRGRRSPLFWWMFERADELRPILEAGRTVWSDVAAALPDIDETRNGAGKPPSGQRARKTWFDVCQAKGWLPKPAVDHPTAQPPIPVSTQMVKQPEPELSIDDYEEVTLPSMSGKTIAIVRIPKR